jgi:hypothetical protein
LLPAAAASLRPGSWQVVAMHKRRAGATPAETCSRASPALMAARAYAGRPAGAPGTVMVAVRKRLEKAVLHRPDSCTGWQGPITALISALFRASISAQRTTTRKGTQQEPMAPLKELGQCYWRCGFQ